MKEHRDPLRCHNIHSNLTAFPVFGRKSHIDHNGSFPRFDLHFMGNIIAHRKAAVRRQISAQENVSTFMLPLCSSVILRI